ncbi:MAG: HRDC domain-containing protein [Candidatus Eremiobacteraeota bacterium]|nr:HRDC domain-containing protein [Candidatus Eremiobacteraeota bacterium]
MSSIEEPVPECTYITTKTGLEAVERSLEKAESAALDTEADSLHHYHQKVCLIQLNVEGSIFIVDPLASIDLSEFFTLLSQKRLILHGADYDLRILRRDFGFSPAQVFDTMLALQLLGYENLGLASLVEHHCGVRLSKSGQKLDWSKRPLSPRMLLYAGNDVRYLPELSAKLEQELRVAGRRQWHRECCEHLLSISFPPARDPEKAWRIKGSSALSGREKAMVKTLWFWREHEASRADVPCFKILNDEQLLALALWAAGVESSSPGGYPLLPRSLKSPRRLTSLEEAIRKAKALSPREWPRPLKKKHGIQRNVDGESLGRLKEVRDTIALSFELTPSILAPQRALSLIASEKPSTREEMSRISGLLDWQVEILYEEFHRALTGEGRKERRAPRTTGKRT